MMSISLERNALIDQFLMIKKKPDGKAGYKRHRRDLPTEVRPDRQKAPSLPTVEKVTNKRGKKTIIQWIIHRGN